MHEAGVKWCAVLWIGQWSSSVGQLKWGVLPNKWRGSASLLLATFNARLRWPISFVLFCFWMWCVAGQRVRPRLLHSFKLELFCWLRVNNSTESKVKNTSFQCYRAIFFNRDSAKKPVGIQSVTTHTKQQYGAALTIIELPNNRPLG